LFLSGGLDSAILAVLAGRKGLRIGCITIGFESLRGTSFDEVPAAAMIAKSTGHPHFFEYYTDLQLIEFYKEFTQDIDQPSIDGFNTWLVSRFAKSLGYKVGLSGAGGDELFYGYPHMRNLKNFKFAWNICRFFFNKFFRYAYEKLHITRLKKLAAIVIFSENTAKMIFIFRMIHMPTTFNGLMDIMEKYFIYPEIKKDSPASASYIESRSYLRKRLFRDMDSSSMAHSLEVRFPLVDLQLVKGLNLADGVIASKSKAYWYSKIIRDDVPKDILWKRKTGFNVPRFLKFDKMITEKKDSTYNDMLIKHILRAYLVHNSSRGDSQ